MKMNQNINTQTNPAVLKFLNPSPSPPLLGFIPHLGYPLSHPPTVAQFISPPPGYASP